ncbi:DNA-dependent ATPase fun30 [Knufia obscura]|uniref:DNA-dependent ATPase fun30 n=1 Tax=Knufia obscura TaxID=1635080 RepID=A0ABR0RLP2_9EURO|nr:DNA-dependent ATPase fun30 [Knufia obscura]
MASSPARSAQSDDDLFGVPGKRPAGYQTQDTIPVQRIIDSPEHDTLASLPPLPQSQYSQAQNHPGYGRTTPNTYSQYVTQPTQIIHRSPGGASATDISSPPPQRPVVQVTASSPMTAPKPKPTNQNGVLGKALGITAPPGTQLGSQFRRPMVPQQHSPVPQQSLSPRKPSGSSQPFHAIDLSDSEKEEQERSRLKRKQFTTSGNRPPVSNSFSGLMGEFGYEPSNPQGVKRSGDTMANSYGGLHKKPRQIAPSRAMPIKQYQPQQPQLDINDIVDPNMRQKVKRLLGVNTTNTAKEAHDALIECGGNFDKAMDYLLLQSNKKDQQQQQGRNPIVLPSSDDELMMTPAKMAPKGVAVSSSMQVPPQASQQVRRAPVKSIAQKYASTQHQPINIAPAPPRRLDAFDTPPPQEPKKRTLMRGRKVRSPSPATRAANAKKAVVLDDSDAEVDSGVQSAHGDASFDGRVLKFFNSCTALELSDMSGIPKDHAEHFVSSRPYRSMQKIFDVQNPNNKNKSKKANSSFGERTWDKVYEMMKSYEAVDWIVKKCENLSKPLASRMSNWGVDVYGKGKNDAGLDLVNIPLGTSQDSAGKDSGIGTPISDDGKPNGAAKKLFLPQPASLAEGVQMKDYQVVGLNWLNLLFKQNLSGILADDMGLGKTLQTIAFIAHLKEIGESGPHLIVVPSATLENWLKEFQRFAPGLDVQPYYGSIPEREQMRADYEAQRDTLNVLVTTYAIAKAKEDAPWLKRFGFTCTVYDEAHQLKNPTSEVATKLIRIKSRFRLLLTGTPLQNNLNELMGLLKFLMPDLFWEVEEDLVAIFKQSISVTTESASDSRQMLLSKQRIDRARSMLTPFILRRKKWQVLKDLPKKTRHVEFCEKTLEQSEIYNQQLAKAWDIRERKAKGERIPADESANVLIRLRQAAIHPLLFRYFYTDKTLRRIAKTCPRIEQFRESNPELIMTELVAYADFETHELCSKHNLLHPYLLPPDNWECSGKVTKMLELLSKFKTEGHRTLIFSQFVMVLDILQIILNNHTIPHLRLDGSTRVDERQDLIDQFNEPESEYQVFMLSTKAGGAGINLTGASRVIVFDSGFNPQDDVQAENRCHRIGQTKDVEIYRLVTADSVEEQIYEMGKVKLQLDKEVSGADGAETAAEPVPSGIATPAELDDEVGAKKGRGKKADATGGLSKKEQEGAALIEDMLFKKLEEDGKPPAPGKTVPSSSQKSNGTSTAPKISLKLKTNGVKKEKDISAFDGGADSPLTELSSSESELETKPRKVKKERSVSPEAGAGRGRRKAAAKASENLKDPFDDEPASQGRTSPRKKGVKKEVAEKSTGQATIGRSGRLVRGKKK